MLVEVALGLSLLALLLWRYLRKPSGLPPGRWGLPLIGYIPLTTKSLEDQLTDLYHKHGKVFLWRMGTQVLVFICDYQLTKEVFNHEDFVDRPNWKLFNIIGDGKNRGVIASSGLPWHHNRRFTLRQLRDLGMGKSRLVEAVHEEAAMFIEDLKLQVGTPAPIPNSLNVAVMNVLWQMVAGRRYDLNNPTMKEFERIIRDGNSAIERMLIPDFIPWIESLLPSIIFKWITKQNLVDEFKIKFTSFFMEIIDSHKKVFNRDEEPKDLIDAYLLEIEEKKDDPDSTFCDMDLVKLIQDLFSAGNETTATTLRWLFYYMANYPEVQMKMQQEIDEVLPQGTMATLEDKPRLSYTEAVIHELHRHVSLIAIGVQHAAVRDSKIEGFTIPKGAVVHSYHLAIHRNSDLWDQPDLFLPERWIQDGKFVTKKEGFLPFGVGKRQCLGEALARMELLIFSTAVLQTFSFSPPPGKTMDLNPLPNPFGHLPKLMDVDVSLRKK